MESFVTKIIEQKFDQRASLIEEIKGKGKNNLVFKVTLSDGPVIMRLSNREGTLGLYKKEAWCADAAKAKGVPTPTIIKIGLSDGYAFSIQEFVEGAHGTDMPKKAGEIWFALGQHARILNDIDASDIRIDYKRMIVDIFANDYFVSRHVFTRKLSLRIQNRLEEAFNWEFVPKLCHGNLHLSNVIVGTDGTMHVIDWETATGNNTPQAELAEIYTWNTGKENIARFLDGYGLNEDKVGGMMRDIQTLVLLRLVNVICRKMPKNGDWQQDTYIQETALRLAGISDYKQDVLFSKNL